MPIENGLPLKSDIDDNDYVRGLSEEGVSVRMLLSALKTYLGEGTATPFILVVGTGDDRGLISTEQWSVGRPGDPKESVFGEGDSYGVGKEDTTPEGTPKPGSAWHCTIANTTDMVITSATDITVILASDNSSTTGLFGGEATGNYILLGSNYKSGGVKAKINTLGTVEPDNMTSEYLAAVDTWVPASFMATDADSPYDQKGNILTSCSSCHEQWRFGFNPIDFPVSWDQVTLNINGTDYTKYWARFRITAAITLDPVMEQLKLHTSRFEINADGATEYFGGARYPKTIIIEKRENALKTSSNQNIAIGVGITANDINNKFPDNSISGIILSGVVPEGLDTSIPLQIIIDWYPDSDNAGDIELEFEAVNATPDFVYDGTAIPVVSTPQIASVDTENRKLNRTTFLVDTSAALPGDKLYGSLSRDATPANIEDTFAGGIVITGYLVIGYFWRP